MNISNITMLYLSFIFVSLFSCNIEAGSLAYNEQSHSYSKSSTVDTIPVVFKMNRKISFEFGFPIPSNADEIYYCLVNGDTIQDNVNGGQLDLILEDSLLTFNYDKESTFMRGTFLIPCFQEVRYQKIINPETFIADKMYPLYVFNPIRYGLWEIFDGNELDTINYSIELDYTKIGRFCL